MATNIEICIKENQSTTEKGRILENLTAKVLKLQQFDVVDTIRVTGMEIDVLAKHKITDATILVECKAWDNTLPADVISKLLGNVMLRGASAGWLITTGPLSKDAKGIKSEWETETNSNRHTLAFYTQDRILNLLLDSNEIVSLDTIKGSVGAELLLGDDAILLLTPESMAWVIPVLDPSSHFSSAVVAFDAKTGERIIRNESLDELKAHKNSYSTFQWLSAEKNDPKPSELLNEEFNSIVPVISGDDWTDYRPARPEDFVGRKNILADILSFLENANNGTSPTRLFSLKAPSGMGKSSVILKLATLSKSRKYSKRLFMYAVDVRTAMSPRYAEMALKTCIDKADAAGFTDVKQRSINSSTVIQYLKDPSVQNTLSYLKREGKSIVLVFDQFEELFSKRDLYPLFDNVRVLCNEVDALQGSIILGFAWKTDLTIPAEHPAYYMWANLADRRKEFELSQFKPSEIKSAINLFGKQLGEQVNPILNNYLTKQCQGYPWLLKKLCIHVFKLIHEGDSQDSVIGQRLNIIDLFERDIADLTPDQHACIKEVARNSPADYFTISEVYGNDTVQTLINNRIVIRRASKLTLYWDIFRDYVLNKTIPELLLDYVPQMQFISDVRAFRCLLEDGDMSAVELGHKLSMEIPTIDNIMIDAVMFGVVQKRNNIIHILAKSEEELFETLQAFFKKHIMYISMQKLSNGSFDYITFSKAFHTIYSDTNISIKTKMVYCSKLYNWFVRLGLFVESHGVASIVVAPSSKTVLLTLGRASRRGRYLAGYQDLFWGQTSPDKVITTYNLIQNGKTSYSWLKSHGYRNAIEILVAARALHKNKDSVCLNANLAEVFKSISGSDTVKYARLVLQENPSIRNVEMGQLLSEKFSREWTISSKTRYGNALMRWVKYLDSIEE